MVLPPRWMDVIVVESTRGWMWGWMSEAVSRRREEVERVKWVSDWESGGSRGSLVSVEFLESVGSFETLVSRSVAMMIQCSSFRV